VASCWIFYMNYAMMHGTTNIKIKKTVAVTCSGMEEEGTAYRILRGAWVIENAGRWHQYFVRKSGEWNSFRIAGNDSAFRRYNISWKCWQMNLNVVAFLLPVTSLSTEIYCRLPVANRNSVGLRKQLRSHCTTISTKIKLYKTFTRPDVLWNLGY